MLRGVNIFRIADGKIIERWGLLDQLGLLQQLGLTATGLVRSGSPRAGSLVCRPILDCEEGLLNDGIFVGSEHPPVLVVSQDLLRAPDAAEVSAPSERRGLRAFRQAF